jgi:6-phosphofructokinase 1
MDVRALPQPVSILETMGRDVGWLAGATALAKLDEDHAPHLIYQPERPFEQDKFLGSLDRIVKRLGWAVVVVSEGLKQANGQPVFEVADNSQRDALNRALPGGVGNYLAGLVTRELKIRCRSEKPGLCGRASMLHVSQQDLSDAELVGRVGVQSAVAGHHAHMVSLLPLGDSEKTKLIPLHHAAGDRHIPKEWLSDTDLAVNEEFLNYVRPIIGDLVDYAVPLTDKKR